MWQNRLGLLLILTILIVALPSLTHSEEGSPQQTSTTADSGNHYSLTQMNFEAGAIKNSSLVRIDQRTGQAWILSQSSTPQGPTVFWINVNEGGAKPNR